MKLYLLNWVAGEYDDAVDVLLGIYSSEQARQDVINKLRKHKSKFGKMLIERGERHLSGESKFVCYEIELDADPDYSVIDWLGDDVKENENDD